MIKTVILAAGMARRLQPLTNSTPKCLLKIGVKNLLDRTLDALKVEGLKNVVIVTGFESEQIVEHCTEYHADMTIDWIHNPRFDETNNIYSLWLTKEKMAGHRLLLLDSDILFHHEILDILIHSGFDNCLALRESDKLGEEEIKVTINNAGDVVAINKIVDPASAVGESLGIELFGIETTHQLFQLLDELVMVQKRENDFYEIAFEQLICNGSKIKPIPVGNLPCMEIDTESDLNNAIQLALQLDDDNLKVT